MALIAKAGHQCNLSRFQVLSKQFLSFADPYCFQVTIRRDTFRFRKQPQQGIFVHTSHSCQFFQRHFFCIMPQQMFCYSAYRRGFRLDRGFTDTGSNKLFQQK